MRGQVYQLWLHELHEDECYGESELRRGVADVYDVYKLYIGLPLQRVVLSLPKTRPPKRQTIMINRGTEMSHSYSPDGANVHRSLPNLVRWCKMGLLTAPAVKKFEFHKSKMADGRHFKNRYIILYLSNLLTDFY